MSTSREKLIDGIREHLIFNYGVAQYPHQHKEVAEQILNAVLKELNITLAPMVGEAK